MSGCRELTLAGFQFAHLYDCVDSTMNIARSSIGLLGSSPDACGMVLTREQTAGRGRQGRSWSSSHGAFMGTFLLSTGAPVAALAGYSLSVGVSVAETLEELGAPVKLKWPNDLVVPVGDELKKVGGILLEVSDTGDTRVVLVGIGLNLVEPPADVDRAASVQGCFGARLDPGDLVVPLAARLKRAHVEFLAPNGGFVAFRSRWERRSCFVDEEISLDVAGEPVVGRYLGVSESGALVLDTGEVKREIHAGHVLSWRKAKTH